MAKRASALERYPWLNTSRAGPAPFRSAFLGILLLALGYVATPFAFWLVWKWGTIADDDHDWLRVWYAVFGGWCFILMGLAILHGIVARITMPDGFGVLRKDARDPVVFLRSFREDHLLVDGSQQGKVQAFIERRAGWEEHIADALHDFAPFVAIGRPRDKLAPTGAVRLYVRDDAWQEVVVSLVGQAAGVVLQFGVTGGTLWEVGVVLHQADLRRVLLVVPPPDLRPLGYAKVRAMTAEALPIPLPENPGACDAFMFGEDGAPIALQFDMNARFQKALIRIGPPPPPPRQDVGVALYINQLRRLGSVSTKAHP